MNSNPRHVARAKPGAGWIPEIRHERHQRRGAAVRHDGLTDDERGIFGAKKDRELGDVRFRAGPSRRHFFRRHFAGFRFVETRNRLGVILHRDPTGRDITIKDLKEPGEEDAERMEQGIGELLDIAIDIGIDKLKALDDVVETVSTAYDVGAAAREAGGLRTYVRELIFPIIPITRTLFRASRAIEKLSPKETTCEKTPKSPPWTIPDFDEDSDGFPPPSPAAEDD